MTQIFDAIGIALSSIWVNKIRSIMMVLGNIVAVTSIIAVVSLLQGMNTYVSDAIMKDVGVGTFKVDKIGVITDDEEERIAWRRNPNVTMLDARAIEIVRSAADRRGDGRVRMRAPTSRSATRRSRARRCAASRPTTKSSAATPPTLAVCRRVWRSSARATWRCSDGKPPTSCSKAAIRSGAPSR